MAYIFRLFFRKTASIDYHAACNFSDLHQGFAQTMDEESRCVKWMARGKVRRSAVMEETKL